MRELSWLLNSVGPAAAALPPAGTAASCERGDELQIGAAAATATTVTGEREGPRGQPSCLLLLLPPEGENLISLKANSKFETIQKSSNKHHAFRSSRKFPHWSPTFSITNIHQTMIPGKAVKGSHPIFVVMQSVKRHTDTGLSVVVVLFENFQFSSHFSPILNYFFVVCSDVYG